MVGPINTSPNYAKRLLKLKREQRLLNRKIEVLSQLAFGNLSDDVLPIVATVCESFDLQPYEIIGDKRRRTDKNVSAVVTIIHCMLEKGFKKPAIYKALKINHTTFMHHERNNKIEERIWKYPGHETMIKTAIGILLPKEKSMKATP